jgi:hypothetical protein
MLMQVKMTNAVFKRELICCEEIHNCKNGFYFNAVETTSFTQQKNRRDEEIKDWSENNEC